MGWKCSLPLTLLSPLGTARYFHFYSIRENPMFWDRNRRDLAFFSRMCSWNMPCGNASATHATDFAEQGVEMMCANGKYGTL